MTLRSDVPEIRIRTLNDVEPSADSGSYVLYWMIANRRGRWNYSLERAVDWAAELDCPLIVLEALRCGYRWASDRLHHFVIQGMAENADHFESKTVLYYPYLEKKEGEGSGLLEALAKKASVVVTDDYPCFFLPRMVEAAAPKIDGRFEVIDSNGILPMRAADKVFSRAYDFRRFLQKNLRDHLDVTPKHDSLSRRKLPELDGLPDRIRKRWPPADVAAYAADPGKLEEFPLNHDVPVSPVLDGGAEAALQVLKRFLQERLERYDEDRNVPDEEASSGLSPYLHFGHISAHHVLNEVLKADDWNPGKLAEKAEGKSSGWWGASEPVESFLDELITWRELGFNMCWQEDDYDEYESLPDWARKTLEEHEGDAREHVYTLEEFDRSETHDELWNAAQRQLVREGRLHNYLRMLWGKKILEWTESPRDALDVMLELNNKFALDGRDPNSYSGIFWCLGRYDRAWGPERKIFGKIRYMSSKNTARKVSVKGYLKRYAAQDD